LRAFNAGGGRAFWIDLKNGLKRQFSFRPEKGSGPRHVMLQEGWNVVGLNGFEAVGADKLTVTIGGDTLSLEEAAVGRLIGGPPLGYAGGTYEIVDALLPFHAYFVWAFRPCMLNIP